MTPRQCRIARAACDWSAEELAVRAEVAHRTVQRFEAEWHLRESSVISRLRTTFEKAGVQFIDGGVHYPAEWDTREQAA